jgi:hypothetical protein
MNISARICGTTSCTVWRQHFASEGARTIHPKGNPVGMGLWRPAYNGVRAVQQRSGDGSEGWCRESRHRCWLASVTPRQRYYGVITVSAVDSWLAIFFPYIYLKFFLGLSFYLFLFILCIFVPRCYRVLLQRWRGIVNGGVQSVALSSH